MFLRMPKALRAVCASHVLAAYVLPSALGLAAHLGHGAEHARDLIRTLEHRAEAMGVAHLHDVATEQTYVHSHGGPPHAHDAGVGKLLVGAEHAEDQHEGLAPSPVELSSHVPATGASLPTFAATHAAKDAEPDSGVRRSLLPPPFPPPRV